MINFSQAAAACLLFVVGWRLEAAEVTFTWNRLAYPAKEYGPSAPTVEGLSGDHPLDRQATTGNGCAESSVDCFLIRGEVHYHDHLTGLASLVTSSSMSGWSWYGTVGAWRWGTLELKQHAQTTCAGPNDCGFVLNRDFEVKHRTVLYVGGGLQYRFDWVYFSVTPSFGVVGHWPRLVSVTGSSHLFQTGVRIGARLSNHWVITAGYAHLSNGKGLGLAKRDSPNQGIEQFGLGLSYRF